MATLQTTNMKHINLDAQEDSVKRFVLALTVDRGGSVLELNGQAVACVIPAPRPVRGASTSVAWTEHKITRRCELIDREIDGVLTQEEVVEVRIVRAWRGTKEKLLPCLVRRSQTTLPPNP